MLRHESILDLNDATARIPLAAARLPAVALELAQLAHAAEAVRERLEFDSEPSGYARVLDRLAR